MLVSMIANPEGREIPLEARGPEVRQITFDNAWDQQEERRQIHEQVLAFVEEKKIDPKNIMVRGFEGTPEKIEAMLATGIEHPDIEFFAGLVENIPRTDTDVHDPLVASPVTFAEAYEQQALALYDRAKLEQETDIELDAYVLREPDGARRALLAVMKLPGA